MLIRRPCQAWRGREATTPVRRSRSRSRRAGGPARVLRGLRTSANYSGAVRANSSTSSGRTSAGRSSAELNAAHCSSSRVKRSRSARSRSARSLPLSMMKSDSVVRVSRGAEQVVVHETQADIQASSLFGHRPVVHTSYGRSTEGAAVIPQVRHRPARGVRAPSPSASPRGRPGEQGTRREESTADRRGRVRAANLVGSTVHGLGNPATDDRDEMGVCIEPREYGSA